MKVLRKRWGGVYRADGFAGPTRRYVLVVVLLVGLASLPTLAAIIAGSNQLDRGTTGAMDVPFLPPPSSGPVSPYSEPAPSSGPGESRGRAGKNRILYGSHDEPPFPARRTNRGQAGTSTVAGSGPHPEPPVSAPSRPSSPSAGPGTGPAHAGAGPGDAGSGSDHAGGAPGHSGGALDHSGNGRGDSGAGPDHSGGGPGHSGGGPGDSGSASDDSGGASDESWSHEQQESDVDDEAPSEEDGHHRCAEHIHRRSAEDQHEPHRRPSMPERANVRDTGPTDRTHNNRRHTLEFRWHDTPMWNRPYHGKHHDYGTADRNSRVGRHHAGD